MKVGRKTVSNSFVPVSDAARGFAPRAAGGSAARTRLLEVRHCGWRLRLEEVSARSLGTHRLTAVLVVRSASRDRAAGLEGMAHVDGAGRDMRSTHERVEIEQTSDQVVPRILDRVSGEEYLVRTAYGHRGRRRSFAGG
jgi:hypothetical protein